MRLVRRVWLVQQKFYPTCKQLFPSQCNLNDTCSVCKDPSDRETYNLMKERGA